MALRTVEIYLSCIQTLNSSEQCNRIITKFTSYSDVNVYLKDLNNH